MARTIYGTDKPRGAELRSWLEKGEMSASQAARLGRRDKPPCFASEEQWLAWCIHEAQRPTPHSGYCYDCNAHYQRDMQHNSKCEYPLTIFRPVRNHHDELVGHRRPTPGTTPAKP